jgi:hypothetical protein
VTDTGKGKPPIEEDGRRCFAGCGPQRGKGLTAFYPRRLSSFIGG